MCKMFSHVRVSSFRNNVLTWTMLAVLALSFVPSASMAQQPFATISALSGTVLVNGQETGKGTVLSAGDVVETQAGANVVLELSDGSLLELGDQTKVTITELSQTTAGARVSWITLMWGRIRATLSPEHQQSGSAFDISTPNAVIGVKFSQPDIEVSYDPAKQETVALALTVALAVKNLITDEEKMIPIGSMAVITTLGINVMAGALATGTIATEATEAGTTVAGTGAGGLGTGTMVAIGAGTAAAAAAVGVVAIVASSDYEYHPWAECSQVPTTSNTMSPWGCEGHEVFTVRAGRAYWIRMSLTANTEEAARSLQPYISLSVTLDGVTLPMDGNINVEYNPITGVWEIVAYFCTGPLAPGDHTIIGSWYDSSIGNGASTTPCPLRAQ